MRFQYNSQRKPVIFLPYHSLIYQVSLHQRSLTADWKGAYIVPIFKNNNHAATINYRPISLIYIQPSSQHRILWNQQYGFCDFAEKINKGERADVAFEFLQRNWQSVQWNSWVMA